MPGMHSQRRGMPGSTLGVLARHSSKCTAAHWRARARQATRMRTRCHAHVTCQVKLPCRPPATVSHTVERPQSVLVGRGRARGSRHAAGLGSGPAGGQSCARGGAHGSQAKGCSPRSSRLRAAGRGGSSAAPPGAAPPAPPPPAALLGPAAADRPSFGAPAAGRGGSCMGSPGPPGALCPAAPQASNEAAERGRSTTGASGAAPPAALGRGAPRASAAVSRSRKPAAAVLPSAPTVSVTTFYAGALRWPPSPEGGLAAPSMSPSPPPPPAPAAPCRAACAGAARWSPLPGRRSTAAAPARPPPAPSPPSSAAPVVAALWPPPLPCWPPPAAACGAASAPAAKLAATGAPAWSPANAGGTGRDPRLPAALPGAGAGARAGPGAGAARRAARACRRCNAARRSPAAGTTRRRWLGALKMPPARCRLAILARGRGPRQAARCLVGRACKRGTGVLVPAVRREARSESAHTACIMQILAYNVSSGPDAHGTRERTRRSRPPRAAAARPPSAAAARVPRPARAGAPPRRPRRGGAARAAGVLRAARVQASADAHCTGLKLAHSWTCAHNLSSQALLDTCTHSFFAGRSARQKQSRCGRKCRPQSKWTERTACTSACGRAMRVQRPDMRQAGAALSCGSDKAPRVRRSESVSALRSRPLHLMCTGGTCGARLVGAQALACQERAVQQLGRRGVLLARPAGLGWTRRRAAASHSAAARSGAPRAARAVWPIAAVRRTGAPARAA